MISKVATSALKSGDIVEMHTPAMSRVSSKPVDSKRMLYVQTNNITGAKSVATHINGQITSACAKLMSTYGLEISQQKINEAGTSHGGHQCLRTLENMMKADALNTMISEIKTWNRTVILDIGAKFGSDYETIAQLTKISFQQVVPYDISIAKVTPWYDQWYKECGKCWEALDKKKTGHKYNDYDIINEIVQRLEYLDQHMFIDGDKIIYGADSLRDKTYRVAAGGYIQLGAPGFVRVTAGSIAFSVRASNLAAAAKALRLTYRDDGHLWNGVEISICTSDNYDAVVGDVENTDGWSAPVDRAAIVRVLD